MLVADLLCVLERLAPAHLAQPGDKSGLLVGDETAPARRILTALELTEPVLCEAFSGGCDTILTHHPILYEAVQSLVESRPRERLLRSLITRQMTLIACHTNLDAAPGGLAEIAGEALGMHDMVPVEPASAGWFKLVGYIPAGAVDTVASAAFAAGAGGIGNYQECAFAGKGTGWFTPGPGSHPALGEVSQPERTPEVRWETVAPRGRLAAVVRAFVKAHPYEEPAFDLYPVEDVLPRVGLGRVGTLAEQTSVRRLAENAAQVCELHAVSWSGDGDRMVQKVAVLPGSGRGSIEAASGQCEALITGDLSYHDAEQAAEEGVALIDVPHGDLEWWAFKCWAGTLRTQLAGSDVSVSVSKEWRSPWSQVTERVSPEGTSRG